MASARTRDRTVEVVQRCCQEDAWLRVLSEQEKEQVWQYPNHRPHCYFANQPGSITRSLPDYGRAALLRRRPWCVGALSRPLSKRERKYLDNRV